MTLHEVVLKVTYDSFFHNLTRKFPSTQIFIWCNKEKDVVEVISKDPEEFPLVMNEVKQYDISGVVEESSDDHRFCLVVHECSCMLGNTVVRHIGNLDILNVFPNVIEGGWMYHRLVVFRHDHLEEYLRRIENWGWTYNVVRKVPFDGFIASSLTLTADALFSGLTQKQIDAMLTAYKYGYYSLPRSADIQTIAAREQVPRTTFQEHLKKAENKLVASLVPYIQLFSASSPERRRTIRLR